MRPLSTVAPEVWRGVVGVATDLDDTLTEQGVLLPSSLGALTRLASEGIPCVVATGRPLGWAEVLARVLPVRAVVAENGGAWVVREARGVRVAFLEDDAARARGMERVEAMIEELVRTYGFARNAGWATRVTDVTVDVGERVSVPREAVWEALARVRAAGLYGVASTVHLHVSARPPDKVEGLRAALGDLGLDPHALDARWAYVGDSPNDAGPFGAMALSVGVSTVVKFEGELPALPKYITRGGAGEGFAEVVDAVVGHRGGAR